MPVPRRHATRSPSSNCPPASAAVTAPPLGGSWETNFPSQDDMTKVPAGGQPKLRTLSPTLKTKQVL